MNPFSISRTSKSRVASFINLDTTSCESGFLGTKISFNRHFKHRGIDDCALKLRRPKGVELGAGDGLHVEIAHKRCVPVSPNEVEIRANVVTFPQSATATVPMSRAIKQDIDFGGKLKTVLREKLERDFGAEKVAGMKRGKQRGRRYKLVGEVVIENLSSRVGRAMKDFFAHGVWEQRVGKFEHERNLGGKGRLSGPNIGIKFIAGINRIRKDVVVISHVEGHGGANLLEIADASGLFGGGFRPGKNGKKDRGKDRDDGNDHQKLDQCKSLLHPFHCTFKRPFS